MTDWEEDCIQWRGEVLMGKRAHFCYDYDGLPVDDTTSEALTCTCYHGTPEQRSEEELEAIAAVCGLNFPSGPAEPF
jgi:hypothetical protein